MYEVSSDFVWEMMAWTPGGNEVAVLSSAFPHAALPQSSFPVTGKPSHWNLEHPRQGGTGTRPWQNGSEPNLLWETVPVCIRRHSPTGRKARHLFFGKITNAHQGAVRVHSPHVEAGTSFLLLGRPD